MGHPRGTYRNPGGMVQFWHFFFPVGEESCLVLETTSLDHGNIPTRFVRVSSKRSFFSHHFISFPWQILILCRGCSYFPLGKGYFSLILSPLPRVFKWLYLSRKTIPRGRPTRKQISSVNMRIFETLLLIQTFSFFKTHSGVFFVVVVFSFV